MRTKRRPEETTEGRRLLVEYLDGDGRSQSSLAALLHVGQSSVSLWVHGRSRPEPPMREALELVAGIQRGAWDTDEERARVEQVRAESATPPRTGTG